MEFLAIFARQLAWKEALDVLLVSFLIYQVLLIVRGTQAVQILIGMAFLMVFYGLGQHYQLHCLRWILDNFFDSLLIVTAILFQDEIRNTLANFGRQRNLMGLLGRNKEPLELEEIIEACMVMGRERIGALIVLEKDSGLANYIETGTRIDGVIHSDILYAIFQSSSPLHDGATIISKNRIAGMGCLLPLSKNVDLDRHFGTRHRAAMGISEITDAVAISISGESGKITICASGRAYPCSTSGELRRYLKKSLSERGIRDHVLAGASR